MTEHGTVVQCKKDFALVRIGRHSACAACGKCGMTENQRHVDFYLRNTLDAKEGDVVEVEIPEGNSATLALAAYILPLVPALALMFVAFACSWPIWATLLCFAGGFAVGICGIALWDKARKHKWMQSPEMKSIVRSQSQQTQQNSTGGTNNE